MKSKPRGMQYRPWQCAISALYSGTNPIHTRGLSSCATTTIYWSSLNFYFQWKLSPQKHKQKAGTQNTIKMLKILLELQYFHKIDLYFSKIVQKSTENWCTGPRFVHIFRSFYVNCCQWYHAGTCPNYYWKVNVILILRIYPHPPSFNVMTMTRKDLTYIQSLAGWTEPCTKVEVSKGMLVITHSHEMKSKPRAMQYQPWQCAISVLYSVH